MNILLSNDDGIHALGIQALYNHLRGLGNLTVVAPDSERSAVGHAITLSDPLKTDAVRKEGEFFGYAVSGTPADCVKLAVCALLDSPPDLIISGINLGPNAGISVIYSGTVSAATEGVILGIPSMAISLATFTDPDWNSAGQCARHVVERFIEAPPPSDCLINVNIPNVPYAEMGPVQVTRMGRSRFREIFHKRQDPRGRTYYWLDGELEELEDSRPFENDTDLEALRKNNISVTPIILDHTGYSLLEATRDIYETD